MISHCNGTNVGKVISEFVVERMAALIFHLSSTNEHRVLGQHIIGLLSDDSE